jgi:hypothetical protein
MAADDPKKKLEVHEWSFWIADPNVENANARDKYPTALPTSVSTTRGYQAKRDEPRLAPVSVLTFYGEAIEELDVSLQAQAGQFVAHWPPAELKNRRLRWPPLNLSAAPAEKAALLSVTEEHWFGPARKLDALWLGQGARAERFLAYDAEFKFPVPFQIEGGPDQYRISNTSATPLHDFAIVLPSSEGRRIGWADSIPAGRAQVATPKTEPGAAKDTPTVKLKADEKGTPDAPPIPAAVEAKLKNTVTARFVNTPLRAVVEFLRKRSELDIALDDEALKEAGMTGDTAVTLELIEVSLRSALDSLVGKLKVQYVISDQGTIRITKTKPADGAPMPAVTPGPPVELSMSPPLAEGSAELDSATSGTLRERLTAAGLKPSEADLVVTSYAKTIFESRELVVLFRLPPAAIDEKLPLDVFPEPSKIVRVALVLVRSIDPRLKDEVKELVAQLGSAKYAQREAAEKRLAELGAIAVPALKEALKDKDVEIVFRAERILLGRNESIDAK